MVLRTARRGPSPGSVFYGCSRFPGCRGTLSKSDGDSELAVLDAKAGLPTLSTKPTSVAPTLSQPATESHPHRAVWPFVVAGLGLWAAVLPLPFSYYPILRIGVIATSYYGLATGPHGPRPSRLAFFGVLAFPWGFVGQSREAWLPLDLIAGALMLAVAVGYRLGDWLRNRSVRSN